MHDLWTWPRLAFFLRYIITRQQSTFITIFQLAERCALSILMKTFHVSKVGFLSLCAQTRKYHKCNISVSFFIHCTQCMHARQAMVWHATSTLIENEEWKLYSLQVDEAALLINSANYSQSTSALISCPFILLSLINYKTWMSMKLGDGKEEHF